MEEADIAEIREGPPRTPRSKKRKPNEFSSTPAKKKKINLKDLAGN